MSIPQTNDAVAMVLYGVWPCTCVINILLHVYSQINDAVAMVLCGVWPCIYVL